MSARLRVGDVETWGAAHYGNPCRECSFDWSIDANQAIRWVGGLPGRLPVAEEPGVAALRRPSGGWTVGEYVGHIGDNLRQWSERIQCARLSGMVEVESYDQDELVRARQHAALSLEAVLWATGRAAADWVGVVESAVREGVVLHHRLRGVQRASDIARNNCHDAWHHLWDIAQIRLLNSA